MFSIEVKRSSMEPLINNNTTFINLTQHGVLICYRSSNNDYLVKERRRKTTLSAVYSALVDALQ